jgi:hypothetical protein
MVARKIFLFLLSTKRYVMHFRQGMGKCREFWASRSIPACQRTFCFIFGSWSWLGLKIDWITNSTAEFTYTSDRFFAKLFWSAISRSRSCLLLSKQLLFIVFVTSIISLVKVTFPIKHQSRSRLRAVPPPPSLPRPRFSFPDVRWKRRDCTAKLRILT